MVVVDLARLSQGPGRHTSSTLCRRSRLRPARLGRRGRIDLGRVWRHWDDLLRLVGSIHTGAVSAYDVLRMLSPGGAANQPDEALAHVGRIFKP